MSYLGSAKMTSRNHEKAESKIPNPGRERRAYKPPALSRFGRVSGLTMGPSGPGTDGSSGMSNMM